MGEKSKLEFAAGGLVWGPEADADRIAVIHRPDYDDWALPKGKLDDGESWENAALREVREETGCRCRLLDFADAIHYRFNGKRGPVEKVVAFWHMTVEDLGAFEPNDEIDRLDWLTFGEAMTRLDYDDEKQLLASAYFRRPQHRAHA